LDLIKEVEDEIIEIKKPSLFSFNRFDGSVQIVTKNVDKEHEKHI